MSDEEKNNDVELAQDDRCASCEEYLQGWKRALADYDNLKKEFASARSGMYQSAVQQTAQQLIPILDSFDQALRFKPEGLDKQTESWLQGILYVRTQLESVMKEMGIEPFGTIGDSFDPHQHESSSEETREGTPAGVVLDVLQRGWKRDQSILRPAKVIVSA